MTTKNLKTPVPERIPAELLLRHSTPAQSWQLATPQPILRVGGMSPYGPTRREFLIGVGSLLILAPYGCGEGSGAGGETTTGAVRVEHAAGTTEVPRDVERIAALDGYPDFHTLLALDVVPEIAPKSLLKDYSSLVKDRLDEVEVNVNVSETNLEKLAAANPDLILGAEYSENIYDKLSEIAPTVLLHRYESDVNGHLRTVAEALGRPQAAERVISDYADRVDEVRSIVDGTRLTDMPFALVEQYAYEGTFSMLGKTSYAGRTLQAVGVEGLIDTPEEGEPDGPDREFGADVSTELLPEVLGPAEFIVVVTYPSFEGARPLADNPLWNELPVAQNGAVVERPVDIWYQNTALTRMARLDSIKDLVERFG